MSIGLELGPERCGAVSGWLQASLLGDTPARASWNRNGTGGEARSRGEATRLVD